MTLMSFLCSLLPGKCGCEAPEPREQSGEKASSAGVEPKVPQSTKPEHEPTATSLNLVGALSSAR
jgi:hypothetical protein